ncbi:hypothetical protein FOPG_19704 [Fusarium oxysporum f. sp. conglutinans race 2 54008]|uniref:Uncharacterized protein n=1 Tax=Fusarium oxysporum f. sp. conglutinans race 2 54008 TaxID=1089457 RepID=X0GVS9_FUSOX|nr:hypothetical protein FOPG_19704 [Fusarium oxysporum f. sp. conglutinans race 2 54008]
MPKTLSSQRVPIQGSSSMPFANSPMPRPSPSTSKILCCPTRTCNVSATHSTRVFSSQFAVASMPSPVSTAAMEPRSFVYQPRLDKVLHRIARSHLRRRVLPSTIKNDLGRILRTSATTTSLRFGLCSPRSKSGTHGMRLWKTRTDV